MMEGANVGLLDKVFRKKEPEVVKMVIPPINNNEEKTNYNFPEDELVSLPPSVIDTSSEECIAIFKHNLEVLKARTKREGQVERFMLIREDDNFPTDFKWRVRSCNTLFEKKVLALSFALRSKCALEKAGIDNLFNGIEIPVDPRKMNQALSEVDPKVGVVYMPAHFRSTKHFTINTPLGVTGSYNSVETERDFIILDSIDNFLNSGYGYSLSYWDAYLDVSHEALDISSSAIILMEKTKYDDLTKDVSFANTLKQRRVVLYEGDETLAINMLLTAEGVLPSQVGLSYSEYDEQLKEIIDSSLASLAFSHNLLLNQSHAAYIEPEKGHFSNHFDDYNRDHIAYLQDFVDFMQAKFPNYAILFNIDSINNTEQSAKIVNVIGTKALLDAINDYNKDALEHFNERHTSYIKDHDNITSEERNAILQTIHLISQTYSINLTFDDEDSKELLEESIRKFFQLPTIHEQLEAAKVIWSILEPKLDQTQNISQDTSRK